MDVGDGTFHKPYASATMKISILCTLENGLAL